MRITWRLLNLCKFSLGCQTLGWFASDSSCNSDTLLV